MTPASVPPSTAAAPYRSSTGTMPEVNIGRSRSMSASSSPPAPPTMTTVGRGGSRPKMPTAEGRSSTSVTSSARAKAPSGKSICCGDITRRPGGTRLCDRAPRRNAGKPGRPTPGSRLVAAHCGGQQRAGRTLTWRSLLLRDAPGGRELTSRRCAGPGCRPLLGRAALLAHHDPRVFRRHWLSIGGVHLRRRDRDSGAPIDQARPRLGRVEEIVGSPLPQRRHDGKQPASHLGEDVFVVQAGFADRNGLEHAERHQPLQARRQNRFRQFG